MQEFFSPIKDIGNKKNGLTFKDFCCLFKNKANGGDIFIKSFTQGFGLNDKSSDNGNNFPIQVKHKYQNILFYNFVFF